MLETLREHESKFLKRLERKKYADLPMRMKTEPDRKQGLPDELSVDILESPSKDEDPL